MKQYANNELVLMTRRYPKLKQKILIRDSKISEKLIRAWDINHSQTEVLEIFVKEKKNLSDERYWEILRTVWILCGTIEYNDLFRLLMKSNRKEQYYFSTPEEQKRLREMPESFEVYRATSNKNDNGLSWTLDKEYAQNYASMYRKQFILNKTIFKSEIFAFIERNDESEIIIL